MKIKTLIEKMELKIKKYDEKAEKIEKKYDNRKPEDLTRHAGYSYGYWYGFSSGIDCTLTELKKMCKSKKEIVMKRANKGEKVYLVTIVGEIVPIEEREDCLNNELFAVGNYFRTVEEAKNSDIYKAFNESKETNAVKVEERI